MAFLRPRFAAQAADVLVGVPEPLAVPTLGVPVGPVRHRHPHVVVVADLAPRERRPVVGVHHLEEHGLEHDRAERQPADEVAGAVRELDEPVVAHGRVGHAPRPFDVEREPVELVAVARELRQRPDAPEVGVEIVELRQVPGHDPHVVFTTRGEEAGEEPAVHHVPLRTGVVLRGLEVQGPDAERRHVGHRCRRHGRECTVADERRGVVVHVDPRTQAAERPVGGRPRGFRRGHTADEHRSEHDDADQTDLEIVKHPPRLAHGLPHRGARGSNSSRQDARVKPSAASSRRFARVNASTATRSSGFSLRRRSASSLAVWARTTSI